MDYVTVGEAYEITALGNRGPKNREIACGDLRRSELRPRGVENNLPVARGRGGPQLGLEAPHEGRRLQMTRTK